MLFPLGLIIGEAYEGLHLIDLQDQYRQSCKQYKNATSTAESRPCYLAIRAWWL
jgi:hypothetical protein